RQPARMADPEGCREVGREEILDADLHLAQPRNVVVLGLRHASLQLSHEELVGLALGRILPAHLVDERSGRRIQDRVVEDGHGVYAFAAAAGPPARYLPSADMSSAS